MNDDCAKSRLDVSEVGNITRQLRTAGNRHPRAHALFRTWPVRLLPVRARV
jgi:hypothetical protein